MKDWLPFLTVVTLSLTVVNMLAVIHLRYEQKQIKAASEKHLRITGKVVGILEHQHEAMVKVKQVAENHVEVVKKRPIQPCEQN